jgi:ABC-2 type transport system permease protein
VASPRLRSFISIAIVLGLSIDFNPAKILGVEVIPIALGSAVVFPRSPLIEVRSVRSRERFMESGVITMPIFFASNAIYPLDLMPRWLKMIADQSLDL